MLILHNLFDGPKRFGQLEALLGGISPKTLSLRLKELEAEKIIKKKVFAQVPLKVEYSLTEKGLSLGEIFKKIDKWGEKESHLS